MRFSLIFWFSILFLYSSCNKIDLYSDLVGSWEHVNQSHRIEINFKKNNQYELNIGPIGYRDLILYKGNYIINKKKKPNTIDLKNTSNFSGSLYGIIKNIDTNTIQISKFSSKWRLRPISFEDSNALLFHRITTKGNI